MNILNSTEQSLSERLEELPRLWHSWKACILEELGYLPQGFEDSTRELLLEHVAEIGTKLEKALKVCIQATEAMAA